MGAAGIFSKVAVGAESTYGVYTAPGRTVEFLSESLTLDKERIVSQGIRDGRRVAHRSEHGARRVGGDLSVELTAQGMGLFFVHALGAVSTTGPGPFAHEITPGPIDGKSLVVQVVRPDRDGTARAFSYVGLKVAEWELTARVGEYAQLRLSLVGADEDTGQAIVADAYHADINPIPFTEGAFSIAAASYPITEFTLSGRNNLADGRHRIRGANSPVQLEPLEQKREYTFSLAGDFVDLSQYNRYVNDTDAAIQLDLNGGADNRVLIDANAVWDGETPTVDGPDVLDHTLRGMLQHGTDDASALTVTVTNDDAAP